MATKRGKRPAAKKRTTAPAKRTTHHAGNTKPAATVKGRAATPAASTSRAPAARAATSTPIPTRGAAEPTLFERARRLLDAIQRSKLSAPDPWAYTPKARAWAQQADHLLDNIGRSGETPALRRDVEKLTAEVEAHPDYQQARRLS